LKRKLAQNFGELVTGQLTVAIIIFGHCLVCRQKKDSTSALAANLFEHRKIVLVTDAKNASNDLAIAVLWQSPAPTVFLLALKGPALRANRSTRHGRLATEYSRSGLFISKRPLLS
jgi:hypothetical protein